ncbi:MAG: DNA methyltransferase [Candidatus Xenobiia bacterium LiM19]
MAKTIVQSRQTNIFDTEVPVMPEGYYSGDKPNPNLRAFVEEHIKERPYDPVTDDYDVPAFDKPIETTKATAIYNMHTYWSKKPHDAIRQYIKHYTKEGDLVLDPFCGSGGTALAALMEGRKAIAIDRSPAATFITKNYCTPVDVDELKSAFEDLKRKVKPEMDWLYETRCDRCGGKATTGYTVYSQVFQCPRCLSKVPLFDCVEIEGRTAAGKPKKMNACPHCYKRGFQEIIRSQSEKFGAVPVLVSYICLNGCKPVRGERRYNDTEEAKSRYFSDCDHNKLIEIETNSIPYLYPQGYDLTGFNRYQRDALFYYGVKEVADLFTKRNLWALAMLKHYINILSNKSKEVLLFALTSVILNCSRLYRYRPSLKGGFQAGTYYIPQDSQIIDVYRSFTDKVQDLISVFSKESFFSQLSISTQSATDLSSIPSSSLDYIFTDPPYADKVQYGELNFVWEAWLGFDTHWHDEEIIVNEIRGKTEEDWARMMRQAMAECYRVLKPGRWLSLCYHDTSEGTWSLIQDIMAEVGFIVEKSDDVLFIDTGQKSYNQLTADKVTKRDLVINFRKPKHGELAGGLMLSGDEDSSTFNEKVRALIADYLEANPGATKDRIYDEVVSKMVRRGEMEPHNFQEILAQVAEPVKEPVSHGQNGSAGAVERTRWYLKESGLTITDATEQAKEDEASVVIEGFLKKWHREHPDAEGVHYSDIFEHFVYTVHDKPRRPLSEWLLDYFFKTGEGTYRLPQSDEERKLKAEGRARGTHRRIRRYVTFLEQGIPIPEKELPNDITIAEWIRHCKRSGLYEQGRLLYEKGGLHVDNLPEEIQMGVEEDYQTCVRRKGIVEKGTGKEKGKGGGRKKSKKAMADEEK